MDLKATTLEFQLLTWQTLMQYDSDGQVLHSHTGCIFNHKAPHTEMTSDTAMKGRPLKRSRFNVQH